jgi:peptide/nickel transport system permease protein
METTTTESPIPEIEPVAPEQVSLGQAVWRRFRRHNAAVVGAVVLAIIILACLLAPLSPYNPEKSDLSSALQPPSWQHPFGTDPL